MVLSLQEALGASFGTYDYKETRPGEQRKPLTPNLKTGEKLC